MSDAGQEGGVMSTPINLIHIKLWHHDREMLTSPDGKRVEVSLDAIRKLVDNEFYPIPGFYPEPDAAPGGGNE